MNGILFPTDFSKNAENALQFAVEIAKKFNAELHIVYAYQMPYASSAPITSKLSDTLRDVAEKDLLAYENEIICKYKWDNIFTKAIAGDVINVVDDYSHNMGIDLIVMGTKGASGIKEVLIGSNAEEVVKHADKPVLIVPEKAHSSSITKVAFAADFHRIKDKKLFNPYLSFIKQFNAETMLVNIEKDENNIYSSRKTYHATNLDKIFADVKHSFNFEVNVDVLEGINSFIKQNNCDMLAVLSRKHNFFEKIFHKSITNALTCHTEIPMFVIKEN